MNTYGKFEEVKEEGTESTGAAARRGGEEAPVRVRLPREGEILGTVVQLLGANRMEIKCADGKSRNCRVPGRFKRSMWLRRGYLVLVEPWPDNNDKGDIIFQYSSSAIQQLKKRGMLSWMDNAF